nr:hypothetical protein [uncultured Kingella sp.]
MGRNIGSGFAETCFAYFGYAEIRCAHFQAAFFALNQAACVAKLRS